MTNLSALAGFSSGGGGGSSSSSGGTPSIGTYVDVLTVRCGSAGHTRAPYGYTSGHIEGAAPSGLIKNRDTFAYWAQWADSSNGHTGFTVSSYKINKSTGALSQLQGGHQDVWTNTGVSAISTTYCIYDPVHGCFFSGGHNSYPGHSSHYFGYSAGQINTAGALVGGTYSASNADHHANGTYCGCLPQGQGTQYFRTGGYNGSGSKAGGRTITCSSSGISVGGWSDDGNWTSSAGRYNHIYQPDIQTTPSGQVTSIGGTSFNTGDYGQVTLRGSSSSTVNNVGNGYQAGTLWAGYNGTSYQQMANILFGSLGTNNSYTNFKDGTRDLGQHTQCSSNVKDIVGIGNNRFLHFNLDSSIKGRFCDMITFDSSHNPQHIQRFSLGDADAASVLDQPAAYTNYFVVFENNSDTYPKWIIQASSSSAGTETVKSYQITADLSTYNPS
jgi:hypothetical protein